MCSGLFKPMMGFVMLPFRVIIKLSKVAILIALLILAVKGFKRMLRR